MNAREKEIIDLVKDVLLKRLGPSRIILFGSRAKKDHDKHSDFDFAIDCQKPDLSLQRELTEKIDKVRGLYKVDLVYLNSVDEEFRKIILETGELIYEQKGN
ncbi:MAG: nucleotidyltransferase domain-containing protein [bacterium]